MSSTSEANFAPFAERMRAAGLADIVIENFRHYYETLAAGSTGFIPESSITPVEHAPTLAGLAEYAAQGVGMLGRAAVLKLNGGLGTSMGLERAKSLLVARDGLSFLDIIARQNLALRQAHACDVPLLFLNSFNTDEDTRAALAAYPDLQGELPLTVMQNKVPKVLQETLAPIEWPADPDLEWCPPGHGEVYVVLRTSGALDALIARGYEYLFVSNADNLGATLDPAILGYLARHRVPFLMEVARRTEADKKGGHIARNAEGRLILREVAQCPEADLTHFQDVERHRYFNTNNIWVHLPTLRATLDEYGSVLKLPMIRNAKTVDPKDGASPKVYQLETAMGAAIEVFPGAQALHVTRERFMPVKLCSDLLALRSDVYTMGDDFRLRPNPDREHEAIAIELDSKYYKLVDDFEARFPATPSLVGCERLSVQGDILFEQGVTVRGTVRVSNDGPQQRRVARGTVLDDTAVSLSQ
ncbi:MAG: UTP--glucose-phosphate uridylyltransferase [Chloroflexota bacterium]|jgi:UTP--glucose-1-phosphate uridylyltransferase